MPLPELLSGLSHSQRTRLLLVRCKQGREVARGGIRCTQGSERPLGVFRGTIAWAASSVPDEREIRDVAFGLIRLHHGDFTFLRAPEGVFPEGEGSSAQELLLDALRRLDEETREPGPKGRIAG